jgi:4,5-dihydroxyphthalate decarboxylase
VSLLRLSFGSGRNEHTQALIDGSVTAEGIDLIPTVLHPGELFLRQLRNQEFDVSEMSLSSLFIARSLGLDLIAIPVFPSRRFFHTELDMNLAAGIAHPSELRGKRIGVGEYQQTAALWLRAVLDHDFGVSQYDVEWYMERGVEFSHGGVTGFEPPQGISLTRIPPDKSLATMLLSNELDAAFVRPNRRAAMTNLVERSQRIPVSGDWSAIVPAFGDGVAEGARFFREHGYIPINHTYVIRGAVLRQHPWIALNLCTAFLAAKLAAQKQRFEDIPLGLVFRWEYLATTRSLLGDDPFPYGFDANRAVLDAMIGHSYEQGLIGEKFPPEELFAPSTLSWAGTTQVKG